MRWFKMFMAVCFAALTGIAFYGASKSDYAGLLVFAGVACFLCAVVDIYDFFGVKV